MSKYYFSAYAVTHEFDLNAIAQFFGIDKIIKWEEPLILTSNQIQEITDLNQTKLLFVYSFGTMVFINFSASEMTAIIDLFEKKFNILNCKFTVSHVDEYELNVGCTPEFVVDNNQACILEDNPDYLKIVALILARSVALEKMEISLGKAFDEAEHLINSLKMGSFRMKNKMLPKLISKVLRFKYESISYIMLFDKPDITWNNSKIDEFYYELFKLFELKDRYEQAKSKHESIINIIQCFSKLSYKNRKANLSLTVIVLIIIFIFVSAIKIIHP